MKQFVLKCLGFIFLGIGILGVFLPLLPTTPLVLLALYCFKRSSPHWEAWILKHPWLGPPVLRWQNQRTVSSKVKASALGVLSLSMSLSVFLLWSSRIVMGLLILWLVLAIFILRLPTKTK